MLVSHVVLTLALTPAHFPSTAPPRALAGSLLKLKRIKDIIPVVPPTALTTSAKPGIEVSVGPLPSDVGGPADEAILRAARLGASADDAVAFFRLRTPPGPDRKKVVELVGRLGGDDLAARDVAHRELVAIGPPALPFIREAVNNIDEAEAATRARQIVAAVGGEKAAELVIHNARLLAAKKPAAAAEVLLDYLPFAENNDSFHECEAALLAVAMPGGKPDPAVLKALKDKNGIRRSTAAQVLSQVGGPAHYAAVRTLLKDPLPSVRLRVVLSLVAAHDGDAVPILIDLLGELPASLKPAAEAYLLDLAGEWAVAGPKGHDMMSRKLRRDVWQAWWKNTDGSTLLEEFRSRTPSDDDMEKIAGHVAKLAADNAPERDAAHLALLNLGKKATSQLRRASAGGPLAAVAAKTLEAIEKDEPNPLPGVAARLLALRKPEGAVETLLGYIAVAESEEVYNNLLDLLSTAAVPGGKADEALLKGLRDKSPLRRAVAATVICRGKAAGSYPLLRKMLDDKDAMVRLRIGEGLAAVGDKIGITAVIAALKDLSPDEARDAEYLLRRVAGDKAPEVTMGDKAEDRAKASEAWGKWWKDNEAAADMTRAGFVAHEGGQTLVIEQYNPARGNGRVIEVDRGGKPKWDVTCNGPNFASLLRNGNVLLLEQGSNIVEKDRKGKQITNPIGWGSSLYVERLPDDHTLVGCTNGIFVYNKVNAQVVTHYYNQNSLAGIRRFADGTVSYVSHSGHFVKLDKSYKETKTFQLPWGGFGVNGADLLPDDRVVVSLNTGKIVCFTPDGKQAWSVNAVNPQPPTATAGGNVLVVTDNQTKILEIDRRGRIVKEMKGFDYKPFRVVRR